jgi:hypothetical protein
MKTFLLSIFALAIVTAPVLGEDDKDHPKQPKNNRSQTPPAQPKVNVAPRPVAPHVQNNLAPKPQFQPQNRPPKSYTPDVQARLLRKTPRFTPADQDAPRTNNTTMKPDPSLANNRNRRNLPRTGPNVVPPTTNVTPNTTVRNPDGRNRTNNSTSRYWQHNNTSYSTYTFDQARRRHHRDHHHRSWWRSHYNRIVLFGGGYYYWNDGYWYPAYGYDPYYSTYAYDEPIYGYNELPPGQVIANVQTALQEQGYYNDAVDGLIGPNTRVALSNFQRDYGLPITAAIDGPTLKALGLY